MSKPFRLGRIVGTKRVLGVNEGQLATHMQVIGATGTGKSKFLEHLIREHISSRRGLCLLDPHGELVDNVLAWGARLPFPPKRFHVVAPHRDDWTVCYNPMAKRPATPDDWFIIKAMKLAVIKAWGADNTQQTPLLDEWLERCFYTAITLGMTLPEVGMLLDPSAERNVQRMAIAAALPESGGAVSHAWLDLCRLAEKKPVDFRAEVGSTTRRLAAFLNNPRLSRIFGVPDVSLDLAAAMDESAVILVDLSTRGRLHAEDAHLFGTLLLTDFYCQMFNRSHPERPFTLFVDEFQNYATKDLARMLDEARKFGLNLVLAHQRPGQLQNSDKAEDRDLYSAVMTNARNKVVFGGVFPDELEPIARALSMGVLDPHKIKREIYARGVMDYVKEYWTAHSHSSGTSHTSGSGGSSSHGTVSGGGAVHTTSATYEGAGGPLSGGALHTSESTAWSSAYSSIDSTTDSWSEADTDTEIDTTTEFPVLVPQMGEQLSSVYYETLDEQLYQFMAILHDQQQRQAMVRLAGQQEPVPIVTPWVATAKATPKQIERQLALGYNAAPWFLPSEQATAIAEERRRSFLALGVETPSPREAIHATIDAPMNEDVITHEPTRVGSIEVQQRDLALLRDVFESRFITIEHAWRLHFSDSTKKAASTRLRELADAKLLTSQAVRAKGARVIYRLSRQGIGLLESSGMIQSISDADWESRLRKRCTDRIADSTLSHEIAMLDIKAAATKAITAIAHLRLDELGIWPLEYEFATASGSRRGSVQPDGFLRVSEHWPNQEQPNPVYFYLEMDRGTEKHEILIEKAVAYNHHLRAGGFQKWLGQKTGTKPRPKFRVLFIVDARDSWKRAQNICESIYTHFTDAYPLVWTTTLKDFRKDPLAKIWLSVEGYKAWRESGKIGSPSLRPLFKNLSTDT